MTVSLYRILEGEEFHAMGEEAVAKGWYRNDSRTFTPGMAWYCPWTYAPPGHPWRATGRRISCQRDDPFLSIHYWRDWADKRPPITVVCPNGEWWEIDRKSSNGTGWTVTGNFPLLIVTPSIVVDGYHGWLGSSGAQPGHFTGDIEGQI